jgi:hypothetical protein
MRNYVAGSEMFTGVIGPLACAKYVTKIWKFQFFNDFVG